MFIHIHVTIIIEEKEATKFEKKALKGLVGEVKLCNYILIKKTQSLI